MNLKQILAVAISLCALSTSVYADTLNMKSVGSAPPNNAQGIDRPTRGMTMDQVLKKYGEPIKRLPAVGEPPITRWVYDKFTVYFEHQYTIHAVINRK